MYSIALDVELTPILTPVFSNKHKARPANWTLPEVHLPLNHTALACAFHFTLQLFKVATHCSSFCKQSAQSRGTCGASDGGIGSRSLSSASLLSRLATSIISSRTSATGAAQPLPCPPPKSARFLRVSSKAVRLSLYWSLPRFRSVLPS